MNKKISYKLIAEKTGCSLAVISRFFNNKPIKKANQIILEEYVKNAQNAEQIKRLKKTKNQEKSVLLLSVSFQNHQNYQVIRELDKNLNDKLLFLHRVKTNNENNYAHIIKNLKKIQFSYLIVFYNVKLFDDKKFVKELIKIKDRVFIYGTKLPEFQSFYVNEQSGIKSLLTKIKAKNKFKKIAYVGVDPTSSTIDQQTYQNRYQAILDWNQNENLPVEIFLCPNNELETATNYLRDSFVIEPDLIICGSHTIFRASANFNNHSVQFSDIGYMSLNDAFANFSFKILINYNLIGRKIFDAINMQEHTNYELVPVIISK
ncbi:DNA-binding LacI/PurR family transcriptional regulator [Mycoplasmoides fastidiosum]|uniref:DNA-binding LacI/PurR family transcriptional regulator n=1 Tax=Mycoplasmoides fastidiosum TaxID=92758 RepID=A0ABU0LYR6_9BACT|nr:hypothetical protein [Mycoplasmoides fastidiosum]MDQ0513856.1 DNA-binding LacI/PurR family transcriptional regulator [Mycoplasmoides fastidiosum]UUD37730.1 hypothetical protein NPA10_04135 [Mycoplasmoides fastidiosum]